MGLARSKASSIDEILRRRVSQRYPLALKRDEGQKFDGIELQCDARGLVSTKPAIQSMPHYNSPDFPSLMHFVSYSPTSIKRAVFLGLLARIDTYTIPEENKHVVLAESMQVLVSWCGFPERLLRRWALECAQSRVWITAILLKSEQLRKKHKSCCCVSRMPLVLCLMCVC